MAAQKHKWYLASAIDAAKLSEINFKPQLLDENGEPFPQIVEFYDGRLFTKNEPYVAPGNETPKA